MTSPSPADDQDTITALLDPGGLLDAATAATPDDVLDGASAVTPTAAVPAQDRRSDAEKIEASWARMNSDGRSTSLPDNGLQLWNFGVGSTRLRPGHKAALKALIAPYSMSLQLIPGAMTALVQGSASDTGSERANGGLAVARAQTVAAWLESNGVGVPTESVRGWIMPEPTSSGAGFAAVRAVFVHLAAQPQTPPPVLAPAPAPMTTLVSQPATRTPEGGETSSALATVSFPRAASVELLLVQFTVMTVPPNAWVNGDLQFEGKITIRTTGEADLVRLKAAVGAGGGELTTEFLTPVTEWLTAKVEAGAERSAGGEWELKAAVSAVMDDNGKEWDVGLQASALPIFFKSPESTVSVPSEDLRLGLPPGFVVEITGQFKLQGVPGPAAIEAAGAALPLAPAAGAAVALTSTLGGLYWLASTLGSPATGLLHGAAVAARYGFAAEVAREVMGGASLSDVDAFLLPYRAGGMCDTFAPSVTSGQSSAAAQLAALADGTAARLAALLTRYGTDTSGVTRDYGQLADAMLTELGGASYSTDAPALSQL